MKKKELKCEFMKKTYITKQLWLLNWIPNTNSNFLSGLNVIFLGEHNPDSFLKKLNLCTRIKSDSSNSTSCTLKLMASERSDSMNERIKC